MKRLRVYLSGGMQYANGQGASWRSELGAWIRSSLGHTVIDPVHESQMLMKKHRAKGWDLRGSMRETGDWPRFFRLVVDRDVRLVRSSDYIVCLWNTSARKGAGTQGELTVGREARIPVYVVSRTPLERLPGWIQGCTTKRFSSFASLRNFLTQTYGT